MNDAEFMTAFETGALPKGEWTHRAHIRMAWICLDAAEEDAALLRVRAGIQRYNASKGVEPAAYHETVTGAFVRLIAHRRVRGETFEAFASRNPDLFDRASPVLLRHYRRETIESRAAHDAFVAPDLAPLPEREARTAPAS